MSSVLTETLVIRVAREVDYDSLCDLWREMDELHARLLPAYFRSPRRPSRTPAELAKLLRDRDETLRVAEVKGAVVGLLHVQLYDTPPADALTPRRRAHIESLIVASGQRRKGIGRRLVDEAAGWGRDRGAGELVLTVWSGNVAADRFYRKLGFGDVSRVLGRNIT